jgi:hypothetical protein
VFLFVPFFLAISVGRAALHGSAFADGTPPINIACAVADPHSTVESCSNAILELRHRLAGAQSAIDTRPADSVDVAKYRTRRIRLQAQLSDASKALHFLEMSRAHKTTYPRSALHLATQSMA